MKPWTNKETSDGVPHQHGAIRRSPPAANNETYLRFRHFKPWTTDKGTSDGVPRQHGAIRRPPPAANTETYLRFRHFKPWTKKIEFLLFFLKE